MSSLHIDRLALRAPELSEREGRDLARLVAERLAALRIPEVPSRERIRISVSGSGVELESVADRIVAQLAADLEGSSW